MRRIGWPSRSRRRTGEFGLPGPLSGSPLDRRHSQELGQQELVGRIRRIQDRLEGEWGRPLEVLLAEAEPVEGEPEDFERRAPGNRPEAGQDRSGQHAGGGGTPGGECPLEFLLEQREDLNEARDDLRAAIRQINETATQLFQTLSARSRRTSRIPSSGSLRVGRRILAGGRGRSAGVGHRDPRFPPRERKPRGSIFSPAGNGL